MSLAALNIMQVRPSIKLMNSFVPKDYNLKLVEWLFEQLSTEDKFDLNHSAVQNALSFDQVTYD
jgi:hypothetical protein